MPLSCAERIIKHEVVEEQVTLNSDEILLSSHITDCSRVISGVTAGLKDTKKPMKKVASKKNKYQSLPKTDEKQMMTISEKSQVEDEANDVINSEWVRPDNKQSDGVPYNKLCDICGQVFDDLKMYRTHKMKFHRNRKKDLPVQCQICGISFANRPNLRRHMYQHSDERPHLCQHCGEGFIQRKSLQDHVTSRHPDKVDRDLSVMPYKCRKCGEKLYNSYSYRRHVKVDCKLQPRRESSYVPATETNSKPFACEKCGRRFALKASVIIHSRLHTDEWAFHLGRRGTRYGQGQDKADNVCHTCGKKFNFHATLVAHERIHTGEKPFKCTFCGLAVATACQLHGHVLRHTGEMPHSCGVCGKGFRLRANLLSHERTHTGEKPFTCPDCGRQLAHAAQLIDHMRIHTGEKPFECKVCGKQMRQRAHLTTHMRTHTGERPYKCQLCEKSYKQIADLRFHYRRMHQFELPKNPDRRPFNVDEIRMLASVNSQTNANSSPQ